MTKNSIAGIIPSRYGSTRFPGKPLALIGGKSMIRRVYEQSARALPTVVVATDDERILQEVESFGGKAVMTSPHHQSGTDRCAEALNRIERATGKTFGVVVNIQGDEPFLEPDQLETLLECFKNPATQIATLIKPAAGIEEIFDANKPKVVTNATGEALYFSRSPIPFSRGVAHQDWLKNHSYYIHIGLYGYRAEVLRAITRLKPSTLEQAESLEQLRWLENGYRIATALTSAKSLSIDTPDDLKSLEQMNLF